MARPIQETCGNLGLPRERPQGIVNTHEPISIGLLARINNGYLRFEMKIHYFHVWHRSWEPLTDKNNFRRYARVQILAYREPHSEKVALLGVKCFGHNGTHLW